MTEFDYDTELAKAREAAVGLQEELEATILGQTRPAWQCFCGEISYGEARAVEIEPAGKTYDYQIIEPLVWGVVMKTDNRAKSYSLGLTEFLPRDAVREMFDRHFAGIDAERITSEYFAREPVVRRPIC